MRRVVPSPPPPLTFPRADPDALKAFDPRTKICVMNCGPHNLDPRDDKERKFLCDDCYTNDDPERRHHALTHEQVAEISRLASLWATARVRKALVSHGCGAPTENHLQVGKRERNANSELHEYLRTLLPHNRSSLNDITRNP